MALRLRRGTDAERQSITPKQGELLYVTDTGLLYVGDGTTQGGNRVSGSLQDESNPTLSATLDLNGNDIVGTGNINIDGNITATGNINIGDGVEDNVIVGGTISSDLVPTTDTAFDLGSETFRWQNGYFTGLNVDGELSAESITVGTIFKEDSVVLYDGLTDTIAASSIEGDLEGSVFGENSSLIIDATNNSIFTSALQISGETISVFAFDPFRVNTPLGARFDNSQINGSANGNLIVQNSSRTINNQISPPDDNDYIGGYAITGYNGVDFTPKSLFATQVLSSAGSGQPSKIEIYVEDNEENFTPVLTINPNRSVSADIFTTGTYDNDNDRDAKIASPIAGMIIFNIRDDSTGTPVFQGFDGTNWVDLN